MGIALEEAHIELGRIARQLLRDREALAQHRAMLDLEEEALPGLWKELAQTGWLGLHLPTEHGGSGYGIVELAVVVEELGRVAAPGPFLPTVVASAVIATTGTTSQQAALLPGLADGSVPAALGLSGALTTSGATVEGDAGVVLSATVADLLFLRLDDAMIAVPTAHPGVEVIASPSLDRGRRVGRVWLHDVPVEDVEVLSGGFEVARKIGRTLAAAEAAGGAAACSEDATEYAKSRVAFGRPVGQFQAVKHHCANMFVQSEMALAAAWDAPRFALSDDHSELSASAAAAVALPAFLYCSRLNIQVHGGIGFTYDHDAHLFFRRAMSLIALFGPVEDARERVLRAALAGARPVTRLEMTVDEGDTRADARAFRAHYESLTDSQRRDAMIDSGFLLPHWPPPWGRSADIRQQIAIDEELSGIPRSAAGGWLALTLSTLGTPDQQQRWVRPALDGSIRICQLFSEPDAGSDLASLRTRAERVDGGWLVNGQKVWTSGAMDADWGYALVRTNPDVEKHAGISVMMIEMTAPGVDRRGLRQITGDAHFAEVFLDDVFVPDSDVIGEIDHGWSVARITMGNERMVIGSTITHVSPDLLLRLVEEHPGGSDPLRQDVGAIVAEHHALSVLDLRRVIRALAGNATGAEGNITKLVGNELDQRLTEIAMRILGPDAAAVDGDNTEWGYQFLFTRAYTLGGGTSEISRNTIGERILGLPRDPPAH